MFTAHQLLTRQGPLRDAWIAFSCSGRLKKSQADEADIKGGADALLALLAEAGGQGSKKRRQYASAGEVQVVVPFRVAGPLMVGLVRIFKRKVDFLEIDAHHLEHQLRDLGRPRRAQELRAHTLPDSHAVADVDDITLGPPGGSGAGAGDLVAALVAAHDLAAFEDELMAGGGLLAGHDGGSSGGGLQAEEGEEEGRPSLARAAAGAMAAVAHRRLAGAGAVAAAPLGAEESEDELMLPLGAGAGSGLRRGSGSPAASGGAAAPAGAAAFEEFEDEGEDPLGLGSLPWLTSTPSAAAAAADEHKYDAEEEEFGHAAEGAAAADLMDVDGDGFGFGRAAGAGDLGEEGEADHYAAPGTPEPPAPPAGDEAAGVLVSPAARRELAPPRGLGGRDAGGGGDGSGEEGEAAGARRRLDLPAGPGQPAAGNISGAAASPLAAEGAGGAAAAAPAAAAGRRAKRPGRRLSAVAVDTEGTELHSSQMRELLKDRAQLLIDRAARAQERAARAAAGAAPPLTRPPAHALSRAAPDAAPAGRAEVWGLGMPEDRSWEVVESEGSNLALLLPSWMPPELRGLLFAPRAAHAGRRGRGEAGGPAGAVGAEQEAAAGRAANGVPADERQAGAAGGDGGHRRGGGMGVAAAAEPAGPEEYEAGADDMQMDGAAAASADHDHEGHNRALSDGEHAPAAAAAMDVEEEEPFGAEGDGGAAAGFAGLRETGAASQDFPSSAAAEAAAAARRADALRDAAAAALAAAGAAPSAACGVLLESLRAGPGCDAAGGRGGRLRAARLFTAALVAQMDGLVVLRQAEEDFAPLYVSVVEGA